MLSGNMCLSSNMFCVALMMTFLLLYSTQLGLLTNTAC